MVKRCGIISQLIIIQITKNNKERKSPILEKKKSFNHEKLLPLQMNSIY
jgi:hypothetical protein